MDKVQKIIEETERRITRLDHACKPSEKTELVSLLEFMKTVQREPDVVEELIIIKPKKEKVNAADVIDKWCKAGQLTAKDIAAACARASVVILNAGPKAEEEELNKED